MPDRCMHSARCGIPWFLSWLDSFIIVAPRARVNGK